MSTFGSYLEAAIARQTDDGFARSVGAFELALAASSLVDPVTPPCLTLFGLHRRSTAGDLRAAYRARARETHPDVEGGSVEAFRAVNAAYEEARLLLRP